MLMKMLPIVVAGIGINKNFDKIKMLMDYGTVSAVQAEMSGIAKVIKLSSIEGEIPESDPEKFAQYLRTYMGAQSDKVNRDFSKDMWQTPYKLEITEGGAVIISAGPDKSFGSKDDIKATVKLN